MQESPKGGREEAEEVEEARGASQGGVDEAPKEPERPRKKMGRPKNPPKPPPEPKRRGRPPKVREQALDEEADDEGGGSSDNPPPKVTRPSPHRPSSRGLVCPTEPTPKPKRAPRAAPPATPAARAAGGPLQRLNEGLRGEAAGPARQKAGIVQDLRGQVHGLKAKRWAGGSHPPSSTALATSTYTAATTSMCPRGPCRPCTSSGTTTPTATTSA